MHNSHILEENFKTEVKQLFSAFKLINNNFLGEKYMFKKTKEETKTKSTRPNFLKTLNMNQF